MMKFTEATLARRIDQGTGRSPADLVLKGGRFLNVVTGEVAEGDIAICGDTIVGTYESYAGTEEIDISGLTAVPGFIDTHLHVESSLVTPHEFDRCVLPKGTTTAICDPHEIANVLGIEGIEFFLQSARELVMDLHVQLSSCVPATDHLETSGANLSAADLLPYKDDPAVIGLAEFMNFPGVLFKDPGCLAKLSAFSGGHIDGHAPLVRGYDINGYLSAGILTDHECTQLEEAREKLRKGMHILMREGSVTKDIKALASLIDEVNSPFISFCTDDRNPLEIAHEGHLDFALRKAIRLGAPVAAVYRAASWSAARGFGLRGKGLIAPGYRADIVLVEDLAEVSVRKVIKDGRLVTDASFAARKPVAPVGLKSVKLPVLEASDFAVRTNNAGPTVKAPLIGILPDRIITERRQAELAVTAGGVAADPAQDALKICVVERHGRTGNGGKPNIGRGFVQGFGFKRGALGSSVGHDSHNVCVVGTSDEDMAIAANRLTEIQGGFVAVLDGRIVGELPLPVAGLMSDQPFDAVEKKLVEIRAAAKEMGCTLPEPYLLLAFLPLSVIPHLKITDKGLVDVDQFALVEAFA
jgi:adenine deaminase